LPFLINGIRELYEIITRKYHRIKVLEWWYFEICFKVSFSSFLNFYFICQLVSSSYDNAESDYVQMEQT
jgi:hypothetical protein